jgi:8-oxo-dGTP pyrophosphatase MutT (NUDIX family)
VPTGPAGGAVPTGPAGGAVPTGPAGGAVPTGPAGGAVPTGPAGEARSIPFRGRLPDSAREVLAGQREPVTPRDAATVMLLRPASPGRAESTAGGTAGVGIEVYMLRRVPSMAFAPGAYVFPGGSVDIRDADEDVAWAGPDAAQWGAVFDAPPDLARALVCAAVRETFEESGVLLAGESADSVVADTTSADWELDRNALLDRSLSLAELLARRRLVLRSDLLAPWSRWITPVVEPRRFDTRFFAAALPAGQRTRDVGGEAAAVTWIEPGAAIEAARRGEIELWPPTAVSLAELAACGDVGTALAGTALLDTAMLDTTLLDTAPSGPRQVPTRIPEVLLREGAAWLSMPGVTDYPL